MWFSIAFPQIALHDLKPIWRTVFLMFFLTNIINKNILWVYAIFNASISIFPRLDNLIDFFSVSTPGTTPKATSKKQQLAEKKTIASTKKQQSNKKSVKNNNPSSKSSIAAAAALADANDPLNTSTGYHDLEDVETWVCGVCKCYDPIITTPVKNPKQAEAMMTTEWIGCDCNRWYHKYCTKLKKIDDSFSCVQLGIECLPLS